MDGSYSHDCLNMKPIDMRIQMDTIDELVAGWWLVGCLKKQYRDNSRDIIVFKQLKMIYNPSYPPASSKTWLESPESLEVFRERYP